MRPRLGRRLCRARRRRQLLRQEREGSSPGIGLGGADGRLILGGTLEAVAGAGIAVERVLDAAPRELGVDPVGILRRGIAILVAEEADHRTPHSAELIE